MLCQERERETFHLTVPRGVHGPGQLFPSFFMSGAFYLHPITTKYASSSSRLVEEEEKKSHILMRRYILLRLDAPFICLYAGIKKKKSLAGRTLYYRMNEQVLVFLFFGWGDFDASQSSYLDKLKSSSSSRVDSL